MVTRRKSVAGPPSGRDAEIYHAVRRLGERQARVAVRHRLTPSRVSQICAQVQAWEAGGGEPLSAADRRLVESQVRRERLVELYVLAVEQLVVSRQPMVTQRRYERNGLVTCDRTERARPVNVQALKLAVEISGKLLVAERFLPPHERFRASPLGAKLHEIVQWIANRLVAEASGMRELPDGDSAARGPDSPVDPIDRPTPSARQEPQVAHVISVEISPDISPRLTVANDDPPTTCSALDPAR